MEIPPGLPPRFSPYSPSHLEAPQCTHCLITFTDAKFLEHHMTKEYLEDFMVHKLQAAFFILLHSCLSSKALIHQCSHSPTKPSPRCSPKTQ
ncbi:hypothetical protein LEMLEM_LOCUS19290 [Lemmus lemmus]